VNNPVTLPSFYFIIIFLFTFALCNISSFLTRWVQTISSILLQHQISRLPLYLWSTFRNVHFSASYNAIFQMCRFTSFFLKFKSDMLVKRTFHTTEWKLLLLLLVCRFLVVTDIPLFSTQFCYIVQIKNQSWNFSHPSKASLIIETCQYLHRFICRQQFRLLFPWSYQTANIHEDKVIDHQRLHLVFHKPTMLMHQALFG
jgi:hypothetical protein